MNTTTQQLEDTDAVPDETLLLGTLGPQPLTVAPPPPNKNTDGTIDPQPERPIATGSPPQPLATAEPPPLASAQPPTADNQPPTANNRPGRAALVLSPTGLPAPPEPPKLNVGVLGTVDELTPEEYMALMTDEQILSDAFKSSIDVGLALVDIRDRRLYRIEYHSFPDYYGKKWHFDARQVYLLTATAVAYNAIRTAGNLPVPEHAFQLKPLLGLAPDKALLAWEHAVKIAAGRKIPSHLVRAAVHKLQLTADTREKNLQTRSERAARRQQLTQTMTDLLELIIMRKPYEELIQKATLLDQCLRVVLPKVRKKGSKRA